ncbi:sulfate transporter CysZ [Halomonas urumqiensis]|uniref:Sulfate transporter CysZ n=1 Tax=Halomonas urumqiensis TaxID=1684789 RepID=A0A2N7UJL0_9GAMM|nr:sulfate transporter CysZ [Halomonas urumqiensis]PMR80621.1 sulfate transporter CysZ [Halomonas urumqiensis]PTB02694.1 sulfate transporter CysZ [Halomonas urumqiensis]GHE21191.1 sulfate transporter CysZ [Halomonas urumqiensis]
MLNAMTALTRGTRLVYRPGMRRYVFLPILVNLLVYAGMLRYVLANFGGWLDGWMAMVPGWLNWLSWLIWPLFVASLVLIVFFTFTLVTHLIAAPFYGFLAAKVEVIVTGRPPIDDRGLARTAVDALGREMVKLGYILPRALGLFVISWIPVLNLFAPLLWVLFSAWIMAITYLDYPMDNNKVSFADMRGRLSARWWPSLTFGGWVTLITWIPLANLFLLPGAVAAAVLMWDRHYRVQHRVQQTDQRDITPR